MEKKSNKSTDKSEEKKVDYKELHLRALADYQNLVRQTVKDKEDFVKFALSSFLKDLLPIYDHLKLSLNGLDEKESSSQWVVGVKAVLKQFKELLASCGVEEIEVLGKKFDHETMDALGGEGDIVEKEVMSGYKIGGKVLRPAKVITKKANNN